MNKIFLYFILTTGLALNGMEPSPSKRPQNPTQQSLKDACHSSYTPRNFHHKQLTPKTQLKQDHKLPKNGPSSSGYKPKTDLPRTMKSISVIYKTLSATPLIAPYAHKASKDDNYFDNNDGMKILEKIKNIQEHPSDDVNGFNLPNWENIGSFSFDEQKGLTDE